MPDKRIKRTVRFRGIHEKFRKFTALKASQKLLFFEAFLFQFIAGLILKLVPFRTITRLFSLPPHPGSQDSFFSPSSGHLNPEEIKKALIKSGSLSPWKNKCLVQCLAARWMLNRRGLVSKLSLGVARGDDNRMIAHAWLKSMDIEVVEKGGDYLELYIF